VYSLAISLVEYLGDRATRVPILIFGTDVDDDAIRRARRGRYSEWGAGDCVGPRRRQRFFRRTGEGYEVSRELRDLCAFAKHDITRDPPFSRLDLLSCRGVLTRLEARGSGEWSRSSTTR
jgi:two-component system CheB/CheR fusion protein